MKNYFKIMLIAMTLALTFSPPKVEAQKVHLAAGTSVENDVLIENLEVGQVFSKNTLSFVVNTQQVSTTVDRTWEAGIKLERLCYSDGNLGFSASGVTTVNLTGNYNYLTFSPGISTTYKLNKNLGLSFNCSTPIIEGSTVFKPINLRAGINLVLTL